MREPDPHGDDGPTQSDWDTWVELCEEIGADPYERLVDLEPTAPDTDDREFWSS